MLIANLLKPPWFMCSAFGRREPLSLPTYHIECNCTWNHPKHKLLLHPPRWAIKYKMLLTVVYKIVHLHFKRVRPFLKEFTHFRGQGGHFGGHYGALRN